jgi:glycosyltransferase involved in cell wall biosynthesis
MHRANCGLGGRLSIERRPMKLSVIIITKNEAHNIAACLSSVSFANEWIVLDSGSTDATADIARQHGAQVMVTTDWPGFGKQKNRALDLATGKWVLSIDADERVTPELAAEISQLMEAAPVSGTRFDMPRRTSFCGQWIDHCGWSPDRVVRLFRRGFARFDENLVHESLHSVGEETPVLSLNSPLLHDSYPTPNHYWDKLKIYSEAWALQKQLEGKTASIGRAMAAACVAFIRSYIIRLGFLDGALGFVVCQMQAQATFYKYFQLYFLNQSKK